MTIIDSGRLHRAAEKIAALKPCPFAGIVTVDQVKTELGELLDIWPNTITDDCETARVLPFRPATL